MILTTFSGACAILGLSFALGLPAGWLAGFFGMNGIFLALSVTILANCFKSLPGVPVGWMTLYSTLGAAAVAPFLVAAWGHLRRCWVDRDNDFVKTAAVMAIPALAAFLYGYDVQVGAFSLMLVVFLLDCLAVPWLLRCIAPTRVAGWAAAVWFCFVFGHLCRLLSGASLKYFLNHRNFPDLFWGFDDIRLDDVHVLTMAPFACAAALGAWFGVRCLHRLGEGAQHDAFRVFWVLERVWLLALVLVFIASLGKPFS